MYGCLNVDVHDGVNTKNIHAGKVRIELPNLFHDSLLKNQWLYELWLSNIDTNGWTWASVLYDFILLSILRAAICKFCQPNRCMTTQPENISQSLDELRRGFFGLLHMPSQSIHHQHHYNSFPTSGSATWIIAFHTTRSLKSKVAKIGISGRNGKGP